MFPMPPDQVPAFRAQLRAGADNDMLTDVGYFLVWYSAAELAFTNLTAYICKINDLEMFDTLCRGMDFRVKIERFRRIRANRGGIGPNLDARLTYLAKSCRPLRNRLAHCAMISGNAPARGYLASTIGTLPFQEFGEEFPEGFRFDPPVRIMPQQLLGWGAWLAAFSNDLSATINHLTATGECEIVHPQSSVPLADQESRGQKSRSAKGHKRAKTRRE